MKIIDSDGRDRKGWWIALPTVAYLAILILAGLGVGYLVEHVHVALR